MNSIDGEFMNKNLLNTIFMNKQLLRNTVKLHFMFKNHLVAFWKVWGFPEPFGEAEGRQKGVSGGWAPPPHINPGGSGGAGRPPRMKNHGQTLHLQVRVQYHIIDIYIYIYIYIYIFLPDAVPGRRGAWGGKFC